MPTSWPFLTEFEINEILQYLMKGMNLVFFFYYYCKICKNIKTIIDLNYNQNEK